MQVVTIDIRSISKVLPILIQRYVLGQIIEVLEQTCTVLYASVTSLDVC